ncbi:MAG: hypothetical protein AB7I27_19145 [Bacteriovoracaceae bacterium]
MRLIKQFLVIKSNLPHLKYQSESLPNGRELKITGLHQMREAALNLAQIPSLKVSSNELIQYCPYTDKNSQLTMASNVHQQIEQKRSTLERKANLLIEVLEPLIATEEESTLYFKIPSTTSSLKDVGEFVGDITKNFDQIFTSKFSRRLSLGYKGVEKGSDWFVLKLLIDTVEKIGIKDIKDFLALMIFFTEHYEKIESIKKLIEYLKTFKQTVDSSSELGKEMIQKERVSFVDQLKELIPPAENTEFDGEDISRISNAGYEIGKIIKEKTEIEISGLVEQKSDAEMTTKIETLKIVKTREIQLLTHNTKD